jgi:hypothetical protein
MAPALSMPLAQHALELLLQTTGMFMNIADDVYMASSLAACPGLRSWELDGCGAKACTRSHALRLHTGARSNRSRVAAYSLGRR